MEAQASLKQTVTHLFDAVRYRGHARELEQEATDSENGLHVELDRLESLTEQMSNLISMMKDGTESPLTDLSGQLEGFLETAKGQAVEKLDRRAKGAAEEKRRGAAGERDKAMKSLEAYLASDPLPVMERTVQVRLDGGYDARVTCVCEGEITYEFVLATSGSKLFHEELTLARLGHELKVPVRVAKTLLKGRVLGYERLDQYVLTEAEESGGKLRATFKKRGNGSKFKVVTSGREEDAFVGLEYSDQIQSVNVMNDASLGGSVDVKALKRGANDLASGLEELVGRKVSLAKLSLEGDDLLKGIDCYRLAQAVFKVLGPSYREIVQRLAETPAAQASNGGLDIKLIRERVKMLGALARPVSQSLGMPWDVITGPKRV